jgi:hypothetical protein
MDPDGSLEEASPCFNSTYSKKSLSARCWRPYWSAAMRWPSAAKVAVGAAEAARAAAVLAAAHLVVVAAADRSVAVAGNRDHRGHLAAAVNRDRHDRLVVATRRARRVRLVVIQAARLGR